LFGFTDIKDQFETKEFEWTNLVQTLNLKEPMMHMIWPFDYD